jgi:hypothetical protein
MAAVATGAVMLTGCAPQLGGQVPYTPPTEQEQQTPQTEDSPKRTPQIVIGKARIVPHED